MVLMVNCGRHGRLGPGGMVLSVMPDPGKELIKNLLKE